MKRQEKSRQFIKSYLKRKYLHGEVIIVRPEDKVLEAVQDILCKVPFEQDLLNKVAEEASKDYSWL